MNHPAGPKCVFPNVHHGYQLIHVYLSSFPLLFCVIFDAPRRTIFFWAPMAKWALVAAGVKDLSRPADKLSFSQNVALAATGFIWVSNRRR